MRVLIGCETSGKMRRAFAARGHDTWSCDLLPADDETDHHLVCDVRDLLDDGWDLAVFHPPCCTYLTVAGLHWNTRDPARAAKTEAALELVQQLMDAPIHKIALENPVSCISSRIRKPDQIVQPYEFGHDASKKTCFWLKNLPPIVSRWPRVPGRLVNGRERWANQTDSGQNKLPPSKDRWKLRSETYDNIALAAAEAWG